MMGTPLNTSTEVNQTATRMRAIVYHRYGSPDVLHLEAVPKPVPQHDEVLVNVHAASVNAGDWHLLRAKPFLMRLMGFGLLTPKHPILGSDIAGRVEAVGNTVTQFHCGDEVFGNTAIYGFGGFAEYVCVPEKALVLKPTTLSFEEAAAVPQAALTALQGLRDKGQIKPGQQVLIYGASGGIGTFAVQIAKAFGAVVTAVCSTRNVNMARSIGADYVIDYTKEDFTRNGQRYDLILAVNGYHPIWTYQRALHPEGVYVTTGGSPAQLFQAMLLGPVISRMGRQKMGNSAHHPNQKDLLVLKELLEEGKVTPVIDRRYPLREVVDALRYVEAGHAKGKVVIMVEQAGT
jgi:NADPH:quinone reductase-like Zn-dependent oxidoreductase